MAATADDAKMWAFLGVFLGVIGFVLVLLTKKEDKYAMYYAKQGLVLTVAWVAVWVVGMFLAFLPMVGWLISAVLGLVMVVLWIIGMVYAFSGEMKPIPVVGQLAEKINL